MIISAVLLVLAILLIGGLLFWRTQNSEVTQMRQVDVYAEKMRGLERDRAKGVLADDESASYIHLRAHETGRNLVCRLLLEKKKQQKTTKPTFFFPYRLAPSPFRNHVYLLSLYSPSK